MKLAKQNVIIEEKKQNEATIYYSPSTDGPQTWVGECEASYDDEQQDKGIENSKHAVEVHRNLGSKSNDGESHNGDACGDEIWILRDPFIVIG